MTDFPDCPSQTVEFFQTVTQSAGWSGKTVTLCEGQSGKTVTVGKKTDIGQVILDNVWCTKLMGV